MITRRQPLLKGTVYQKPRKCFLSGRRQRIAPQKQRSRQSSLLSEVADSRQRCSTDSVIFNRVGSFVAASAIQIHLFRSLQNLFLYERFKAMRAP